ncbi:MAG TPA: DUF1552 domain-containing protein [Candidatus Eisenbacteria bacterium]|jgi:hypothetical protein|nr:DUF1552 domain-containing protein [Candidatus Eisenbacteria bacterium]
MEKPWQINRRTFLRGLGTAMALPVLDSMVPVTALAAGTRSKPFPIRMAFLYVPNGINMADWTPATEGPGFELPAILQPLQPFRGDFSVLTGLTCDKARPHGDGGGDHARAMSAFLTGCQARKTNGANIKIGVSADQIAAQNLGKFTQLPSLELGCEQGRQAGNCDSGYSCAYSHNLSWKGEATPMAKEVNPRLIFERLFSNNIPGETAESRGRRERYQKSILDFVQEDARQLKTKLGVTDQRKLEEYLTAVRELEMRLERVERTAALMPETAMPKGIPKNYEEHLRLVADMMVLAFQADVTRVSTFVLADEGSNRNYSLINVSEGHHDLSHHGGDKVKKEKIAKINQFHISQIAYLLQRLKSIKEGDGTLLDNCMIAYGSGNSDGNAHNHDDLPVLLAGRGGGTLHPGRHLRYEKETPLTNLWLAMLDRVGVKAERVGDSTGRLENI